MRRLAYEAADAGLLSPELAAGIRRVKRARKLGVRLGNWLTTDEARKLWQAPAPDTLKDEAEGHIYRITAVGEDPICYKLIWVLRIYAHPEAFSIGVAAKNCK